MRLVAVDVEVFNLGYEPEIVTSLDFEVRDSSNRTFGSVETGDVIGSPTGEVEPGGGLRGIVAYEILAECRGLRLHFTADYPTGSAIIQLT